MTTSTSTENVIFMLGNKIGQITLFLLDHSLSLREMMKLCLVPCTIFDDKSLLYPANNIETCNYILTSLYNMILLFLFHNLCIGSNISNW
jgi:hypothetical protein